MIEKVGHSRNFATAPPHAIPPPASSGLRSMVTSPFSAILSTMACSPLLSPTRSPSFRPGGARSGRGGGHEGCAEGKLRAGEGWVRGMCEVKVGGGRGVLMSLWDVHGNLTKAPPPSYNPLVTPMWLLHSGYTPLWLPVAAARGRPLLSKPAARGLPLQQACPHPSTHGSPSRFQFIIPTSRHCDDCLFLPLAIPVLGVQTDLSLDHPDHRSDHVSPRA